MSDLPAPSLRLEPWSPGDLPVLERNNTPVMTRYLGGPETDERLARRHQRYVGMTGAAGVGRMFRIEVRDEPEPVGSVGYWPADWEGRPAWETGWAIATPYQGRGYARAAMRLLLREVAGEGDPERHLLYADPLVINERSNALARDLGFELLDTRDIEYPPGNHIRVNVWAFDLRTLT